MKVVTKNLANFLTKATVDGLIFDTLLDFGPEGLSIVALDESHTGGVNGLLKKEGNFVDYAEMQVPIKDTARLIKLLRMIDGEAELSVEGDVFRIIGENYEGEIIMAKKDRLKCPIPMEKWPNLGYDKSFEIDGSVLQNAKKTFGYLEVKEIVAGVKDGIFIIRIGNGINDIGIIKSEVDYEDASAVYGSTLMDFVKAIKGTVKVAFRTIRP
jgi:hypothetical protein